MPDLSLEDTLVTLVRVDFRIASWNGCSKCEILRPTLREFSGRVPTPHASALQAARAIGLFTVAIGFGGSMTYGQTVGLTMDHGVHGRSPALASR